MASRADTLHGLPLVESEEMEAWLRVHAAKGCAKQLQDTLEEGGGSQQNDRPIPI